MLLYYLGSYVYTVNGSRMGYEVFDSKVMRVGSPALTIQADGKIALNADVGDLLGPLGAKYVQILWDSESCKLAIRPLSKQAQRAFKLSFFRGKRGSSLSARSFLKYIQWQSSKAVTIPVHWNEKEGLLEADLPRERVGSVEGKSRK
jgi:hypothetical protein